MDFCRYMSSPVTSFLLLARFRSRNMSSDGNSDGATDINVPVQVIPYMYESTARSQSHKRTSSSHSVHVRVNSAVTVT